MNRTAFAAAAALALGIVPAAAHAGQQDFILTNATGYDIARVYVSPVSANDWEEDVMGSDILDAGEDVRIRFSRDTSSCRYDIKVVWTDGDTASWSDFNLCRISHITLRWNNGRATASSE